MSEVSPVVLLVDVDNTLLDNDRIQEDLKERLARDCGPECRDRYWAILERLFTDLGYRDYLGALQIYRVEKPHEVELLKISSYLVDYPFAERLYAGALDVLAKGSPDLRAKASAMLMTPFTFALRCRLMHAGVPGIREPAAGSRLRVRIRKPEAGCR